MGHNLSEEQKLDLFGVDDYLSIFMENTIKELKKKYVDGFEESLLAMEKKTTTTKQTKNK